MPTAPDQTIPNYTPSTPGAPIAVVGAGTLSAPSAPAAPVANAPGSAPSAPISVLGAGTLSAPAAPALSATVGGAALAALHAPGRPRGCPRTLQGCWVRAHTQHHGVHPPLTQPRFSSCLRVCDCAGTFRRRTTPRTRKTARSRRRPLPCPRRRARAAGVAHRPGITDSRLPRFSHPCLYGYKKYLFYKYYITIVFVPFSLIVKPDFDGSDSRLVKDKLALKYQVSSSPGKQAALL